MQGIKLNMMPKNKNARHKINMVRKKGKRRRRTYLEKKGVNIASVNFLQLQILLLRPTAFCILKSPIHNFGLDFSECNGSARINI